MNIAWLRFFYVYQDSSGNEAYNGKYARTRPTGATYMVILEAIASGANRVTEIANEIGNDASGLSRCLANLDGLTLVEREMPVTGTPTDGGCVG